MMRFFRFLLFFLFISLNAAPKMLVFHGENLPPFFCDPDSDSPGFAIELLKEVYPENEYLLSFRIFRWQNAAIMLKRKKISAFIGFAKADYPELPATRLPIFRLRSAVYLHAKQNPEYRSPDSLSSLKTGFLAEYSHSDEFDLYQKQHEKDGLVLYYSGPRSAENMLNDLASGKIQAFVHYTAAVDWALHRMPHLKKDVKRIAVLENGIDFHAVFAPGKESGEHISIFNRRFPGFRKSGKYRELLRKYGLRETDIP